jgi:integrase
LRSYTVSLRQSGVELYQIRTIKGEDMATYQKRGAGWRAIIRRNGQTATATFDSKEAAISWAGRIEAEFINGAKLQQDDRIRHTTVLDLFSRYAEEVSPLKRGERTELIRLTMLARDTETFDRPAMRFSGQDVADWRDARLKVVSGSTVNRELNLISSVFTHAIKEWSLKLPANPVHLIRRPQSARPRKRRVPDSEVALMCKTLGWDMQSAPENAKQHVAWAFAFAVETAMRLGEIGSVQLREVHKVERFVHLSHTKNGEERDVPLSRRAIVLLDMLSITEPDDYLVPVDVRVFDNIFREAKNTAGLSDLHFHDSRREAATRMSKRLSNVLELSAVTGHKTLNVLKVYYAPNATDLADKLD